MSNNLSIQFCEINELNEEEERIFSTLAVRISDDYSVKLEDWYKSVSEMKEAWNPMNIMERLEEDYPEFLETVELSEGYYYNGRWIENIK